MEESLKKASEKLIDALKDFSNALQGGKSLKDKPIKPNEFSEYNVHKLLRIVWVYVKNSEWNEQDFDQNELEADIFPKEFKEKALEALENLYSVLAEPWKYVSNPCEGAWPRKIRG
jgi:hypothetical protein